MRSLLATNILEGAALVSTTGAIVLGVIEGLLSPSAIR